jgi:hypothetical protein
VAFCSVCTLSAGVRTALEGFRGLGGGALLVFSAAEPRAMLGEGLLRLAGFGGGGGERVDLTPERSALSLVLLVVFASGTCSDQLRSVKSIKSCSGEAVRGTFVLDVDADGRCGRRGGAAKLLRPFTLVRED